MKKYSFLILVLVLMAGSLACQTLTNGGTETQPQPLPPVDNSEGEPTASIEQPSEPSSNRIETEYPMLDDARNVVDTAGVITYQTQYDISGVIKFYRDTLLAQGYTERSINTVITDATFNLVFDGDSSGKSLVIQGVDLGNGSTNVTMYLQDM